MYWLRAPMSSSHKNKVQRSPKSNSSHGMQRPVLSSCFLYSGDCPSPIPTM